MALLVEKLEKKRLGAKGRDRGKARGGRAPEASAAGSQGKPHRSRYIAKAVRREVFERDGGQCTHRDASGRRCKERHGLEFDHVVAHALGGENAAGNLRLRCGPHNQLHAEECYGPHFMAKKQGPHTIRRGDGPSPP